MFFVPRKKRLYRSYYPSVILSLPKFCDKILEQNQAVTRRRDLVMV